MADPDWMLDPISRGLRALRLNGQVLSVDVAAAITSATLEHGFDQARTLTLDLYDPGRILLRSDFATQRVTARFGDDGRDGVFVLVKVAKTGTTATLTFEDQIVNALRQVKGALKIKRSAVNRVGFVRRLALDPKAARYVWGGAIAYWTLEQGPPSRAGVVKRNGKRQPAGQPSVRRNDATSSKRPPDPGTASAASFDAAALLTITDAAGHVNLQPSRNQKENAAIVLATARSMGASHKVQVACIETIIVESGMLNLTGGDADSVGLFQQRPSAGWHGLTNREQATREFVTRAKALEAKYPGYRAGQIAADVQRPAAQYRGRYDQHAPEAEVWVNAYRGLAAAVPSRSPSGGKSGTAEGTEWTRSKDETSWDAIKRMADEVQWRAYVSDSTTVIFADDDTLLLAPPTLRISEDASWVDAIDFEWDTGRPAATATVALEIDNLHVGPFQEGLEPGQVVLITDHGPATGPWLIANVRYQFLGATVELDLTRTRPSLPEPKEPATSKKSQGLPGDASAGAKAVAWAAQFIGKPYVWGGGHKVAATVDALVAYGDQQRKAYREGFDCSGLVRCAWAQQGVYVGNTTYDIKTYAERAGVPRGSNSIPPGGWKAGDIMEPHADHVVLMTGDGAHTVEAHCAHCYPASLRGIISNVRPGAAWWWARFGGAA